MTREDIIAHMATEVAMVDGTGESRVKEVLERFAALVAAAEREECIKILEAYQVSRWKTASPIGRMAADWIYDALKQIRDDIRARGGE